MARDFTLEDSNKSLVQASFDRWQSQSGGPFELLDPDVQWTIVGSSPLAKTYKGKKEFIDQVIDPFNARMSTPLVPTVRGIYADGDMVIILFDAAATVRDGKPYHNTCSAGLAGMFDEDRERCAFERWLAANTPDFRPSLFKRDGTGGYVRHEAAASWDAWKAGYAWRCKC
jgi:ketosteroid isomerase-like protein